MLLRLVFKAVSVEPMLFLYYVAAAVSSLTSVNLLLKKACSPLHPVTDETLCDEVAIQKVVTSINTWKPCLEYGLPVVFILFAGAWSDTHGKRRKPLMMLPVMGEIITLFFLTSSVFFWRWTPEFTALGEALIRGLTGGRTCFSFGAITYISDNTLPNQRTFRLAVVTALIFVATPIGNAVTGVIRVNFGFYTVFNVCLLLNLLGLLLGMTLLNRYSDPVPVEKSCGFSDFSKTLETLFKERAGNKRTVLLLMVVISPLFGGCLIGEYSVLYLYLRYIFHWGEVDYGYYSAFRMSLTFFGTLLSIGILGNVFRLPDAAIGLLATTFQFVAAVCNAFAQRPWQMFLYPSIDLMHGTIYTVGHAIVSKIVDPAELGKVNSVLGTVDSLIPLIAMPLYNNVYYYTFQKSPGAFFFISAGFAVISWCIFLTVVLLRRQERRIHSIIN